MTAQPPRLTARRQQVLDALCSMWLDGEPPTMREIGGRLGIKSTNGVVEHVDALEALELVSREHRRAAAICVTPRGWLEWVRDSDIHRAGAATLGPDLTEEVAVRYAFALAGERLLAREGA